MSFRPFYLLSSIYELSPCLPAIFDLSAFTLFTCYLRSISFHPFLLAIFDLSAFTLFYLLSLVYQLLPFLPAIFGLSAFALFTCYLWSMSFTSDSSVCLGFPESDGAEMKVGMRDYPDLSFLIYLAQSLFLFLPFYKKRKEMERRGTFAS